MNRKVHIVLLLMLAAASCAASRSARYVQFTLLQANLNDRAAEALDAGLIDAATGRRILALSEAISRKRVEYREALAAGRARRMLDDILDVVERLLVRGDLFLPDPVLLERRKED